MLLHACKGALSVSPTPAQMAITWLLNDNAVYEFVREIHCNNNMRDNDNMRRELNIMINIW